MLDPIRAFATDRDEGFALMPPATVDMLVCEQLQNDT